MKLRYYIVDDKGQLGKVRQELVQRLWDGRARAEKLGSDNTHELRLVSVVSDNRLIPEKIYLLRVPLTDGKFTPEDHLTLQIFTMPDCVTPQEVIQHHAAGWPADFYRQLAVAVDVPLAQLRVPVCIGGPLLLAAAMRVSPNEARRYLS